MQPRAVWQVFIVQLFLHQTNKEIHTKTKWTNELKEMCEITLF